MSEPAEIRWIQAGIVGGLAASVLYPTLLFAPLPLAASATLAALLGPAIGVGSLGLWQLIRLEGRSIASTLGALFNFTAGALFVAMVLVQLAVRGSGEVFERPLVGVWLGLDVAWDVYIGLGTIFFAVSMWRHPRFGRFFAGLGLALGALVLVLNLLTYPTPPAEAGSVDVGPFVGLWYLAATILVWRALGWARGHLAATRQGSPA